MVTITKETKSDRLERLAAAVAEVTQKEFMPECLMPVGRHHTERFSFSGGRHILDAGDDYLDADEWTTVRSRLMSGDMIQLSTLARLTFSMFSDLGRPSCRKPVLQEAGELLGLDHDTAHVLFNPRTHDDLRWSDIGTAPMGAVTPEWASIAVYAVLAGEDSWFWSDAGEELGVIDQELFYNPEQLCFECLQVQCDPGSTFCNHYDREPKYGCAGSGSLCSCGISIYIARAAQAEDIG